MGWRITLEWSSKERERQQQTEMRTKRETVTLRGKRREREGFY